MSATLLHLSDIHIKKSSDSILEHANNIAVCVYSNLPETSALFILISGDITYSGRNSQYELAYNFLYEIKKLITQEKNIPVHFVITPGNHDCDFDLDNKMRQMAIKCLNQGESPDESVIHQCTAVQEAFFNFRNKLIPDMKNSNDKLWLTQNFDVEGKKIVFDSLNLSWVSRIKEEPGAIVFPYEKYAKKETENSNIRIIVMHHPLNWFSQSIYRGFRQFIRKLASIVVTGHEHQANAGENIDTESFMSAYIEGDALQQDSHTLSNSAFNVITLDLDEETYKSTRFALKKSRYEATEQASWSEYRKLPPKRRNEFEIKGEFRKRLDDPGANFHHPGRTAISLQDIYIYPSLLKIGDYKDQANFISSDTLLTPDKISNGVLLEGEEKVGRTSLLYRFFDEYHDRGFVPIYMAGENIKKSSLNDIDNLVKKSVMEQYGNEAIAAFQQLSISKKLLLLDDFDDCQFKSINDRIQILNKLKSRFGYAIVTVGTIFEVKELLKKAESQELINFSHCQIQPFGFLLRHKLIKKWILLDNDGALNESEIIHKIDQFEKSMDLVMNKNLIPSMPLYLLTLLQSIEAGHGGEFKDSSLGHYYNYLLNEGFLTAQVPKEKLNEFFDYCTSLAWHFHEMKCRELSLEQLLDFNTDFSSKFHTVDFEVRIDKLILSKVLVTRDNQNYLFQYPYIYYFLKGKYLNQNILDINIREYIEKCSRHLYVRENANTILFLAHHTHDDFVLNTILRVLGELFNNYEPIKFSGDTTTISSLISDAPKLTYTGVPPEKYREEQNKTRDNLDDGQDGLVEKEEDGDTLSYIAQLITLFKTVEIIGQILKNKYSSIERPRKVEILNELFSGPLRALAGFYDAICSNPDQLVTEIDSSLKKHNKLTNDDERNRHARQIAAGLIQLASLSFIWKAASSVSSSALRENIHETVKNNGTPAFLLIELGIHLDSTSTIPREKILILKKCIGKDGVPLSLMKILLIRHIYMFRTTEQDKQWLESKLGMDLGKQHKLDFKSSKVKRIR